MTGSPVRPYTGQRRLDGGTASSPGVDEPRSALGSVTAGISRPAAVTITVEIPLSARATARSRRRGGMSRADRTLTVEEADTILRVVDGDRLLTEVPRTTAKQIA